MAGVGDNFEARALNTRLESFRHRGRRGLVVGSGNNQRRLLDERQLITQIDLRTGHYVTPSRARIRANLLTPSFADYLGLGRHRLRRVAVIVEWLARAAHHHS